MDRTEHDRVLSAAARDNDAALLALVQRYHDRVYRFGRRVCRDRFDADDAVQEAFLKLAARPDVQDHAGAFAWLMRVVRNACLRLLRPFRRRQSLADDPARDIETIAEEGTPADVMLERWQLVSRVYEVIATLPPMYREVLVLRDVEGLTGEETASKLGVPEATMKTRLSRARALMRAALTGSDLPPEAGPQ